MTTTARATLNVLDEQSQERVRSYRSGGWLGQRLRARREELGLSQRAVAALIDATPTTAIGDRPTIGAAGLSRIESGHRYPALRTLEALAGALQIMIIIGPDTTSITAIAPDEVPQ